MFKVCEKHCLGRVPFTHSFHGNFFNVSKKLVKNERLHKTSGKHLVCWLRPLNQSKWMRENFAASYIFFLLPDNGQLYKQQFCIGWYVGLSVLTHQQTKLFWIPVGVLKMIYLFIFAYFEPFLKGLQVQVTRQLPHDKSQNTHTHTKKNHLWVMDEWILMHPFLDVCNHTVPHSNATFN